MQLTSTVTCCALPATVCPAVPAQSTQAYMELQRVQQTTARLSQSMQQQVTQLQQQLADRNAAHNALLAEHQEQTAALQREKQELVASLAALQQHDSGHRLTAADAASKVERLRGELLRCVGELQAQLASAATAGQQQQQVQQQLRALEATAAAAREEAAETRQQLVELASVSLSELREQVAGEAAIITGLPDDLDAADLPTPVTTYIKVCVHVCMRACVYACMCACRLVRRAHVCEECSKLSLGKNCVCCGQRVSLELSQTAS